MIKKIGILTFHRASNYGATLQAYALQTILKRNVETVHIIDYRCPEVEYSHNPRYILRKNQFATAIIRINQKLHKYRTFSMFRERKFDLSSPVYEVPSKEFASNYDIFIVGSDQVWSKEFAGLDPVYLLNFADDNQRYSYACSFGFTEFPENTKDIYFEYLSRFNTVSVREKSAKKLVEQELGLEARVDLDPTLLLAPEDWYKFLTPYDFGKPYILVYTVQTPVNLLNIVRQFSKITGIEIIYLNNEHRANKDLKHIRYVTPEQFVGLFSGAEYVFTNSFHGTAFSIIFKKNFYVEVDTIKSKNSRSADLLETCGIESRIIKTKDINSLNTESIDWISVNQKLDFIRDDSLNYLKNIIGEM
ncbi:MAG: polysaccharide pyruvyl transferase family protein [Clostridiales bacterium]|nr:polysaccharide pyruvyl transferase family protein [Clostridiales bacterium]